MPYNYVDGQKILSKNMQTKHDIQQLLASVGIEVNRHLGQHFLIDLNMMSLLLESAALCCDDVVLEVGAGTGSLTEGLSERAARVVAVEIDGGLAGICRDRLREKAAAGEAAAGELCTLSVLAWLDGNEMESLRLARAAADVDPENTQALGNLLFLVNEI